MKTIRLFNLAGAVIGTLTLPASFVLANLSVLGATRAVVIA
ncbi:MAG: hypothetical protein Q7J46_00030 [Pseudomonas sp.]|jgi:hypothetical protein|nr:hypothetical protein [Pseudomonas sp.]